MALLVKLSVLSICISLLYTAVLSQPTSSASTPSTTGSIIPATSAGAAAAATGGTQATGTAGLNAGISTSRVPSLAGIAVETTGNLAKDGAVVANGLAQGFTDAVEDGAKFGAAVAGTGGEMIQIGADKLGGLARLPSQVLFGNMMGGEGGSSGGLIPSFSTNAAGSGGGFSFGGLGVGGGLNNGILGRWPEAAIQTLSALRPDQIEALARAGLISAVNVGDSATARFNTDVVQPWARGAGDTFDSGLSILGVQQPYGRQMTDAAWQMGENRRQDMVQGARDFASGQYRFPMLFGGGSSGGGAAFGQGLGGGSTAGGTAGLSIGGLPGASIQGQTGAV